VGSAPNVVNSRGEVFTDEMRDYLYGKRDYAADPAGSVRTGGLPPDRAREILSNWMFGVRPKAVDPMEAITRASALSGVHERAAAGTGQAGLFGFGSYEGSLPSLPSIDMGPMAKGVPYSIPPLPKIKSVGG
jgi:hypothetical protein